MFRSLGIGASGKKEERDMSCFSNCGHFMEKRGIWLNDGNRIDVVELKMGAQAGSLSPRSHIALAG